MKNNNGPTDTTAPELTGYSLTIQEDGTEVKIMCNDLESGVADGKVIYTRENGEDIEVRMLWSSYEDSLRGYIYRHSSSEYYHEKLTFKNVMIRDRAGNSKTYTRNDKNFSQMDFNIGEYVKYNKGDVIFNSPNAFSEEVTGNTKFKNSIVKLVIDGKSIGEVKADINGNFKFDLNYHWYGENIMVEVYDCISKNW